VTWAEANDMKLLRETKNIRHAALLMGGLLLMGLGLILLSDGPAQAATKAATLEQRLADISLLHNQLQEKIESAEGLREALYSEVKKLRIEVIRLKKAHHIRTFAQGVKIPRIRYNLTLLRELNGYIANFNEKIRFLKIGSDKLYYLYHQAEDDLRIVHTLNDLKIEALLSQIDGVMGAYLPEAHNLLIDLSSIPYETPEHIWEEIAKGAV
jgi:hypothetical protein